MGYVLGHGTNIKQAKKKVRAVVHLNPRASGEAESEMPAHYGPRLVTGKQTAGGVASRLQ
jgi:hypothetical protein